MNSLHSPTQIASIFPSALSPMCCPSIICHLSLAFILPTPSHLHLSCRHCGASSWGCSSSQTKEVLCITLTRPHAQGPRRPPVFGGPHVLGPGGSGAGAVWNTSNVGVSPSFGETRPRPQVLQGCCLLWPLPASPRHAQRESVGLLIYLKHI